MIVPLRVTVVHPVPGVTLMMQRGRDELVAPARSSRDRVSFDFTLRLGDSKSPGQLRWLGEFAQGPVTDRFVYVNVGTSAGQRDSVWTRRAKIKLAPITAEQVARVLQSPGKVLEARFEGTGRDGTPACATVPLIGNSWQISGES